MTQEKKLSLGSIIGYGFGEAGSQLSWTLIGTYLTAFYTDVVGLTPAIIAGIMLAARIWDAINDPMFGTIAENYTHTRWGRFRPYILFGAPILALFNCLTFLNLNIAPMWKTMTSALSSSTTTSPPSRFPTSSGSLKSRFSTVRA